MAKKIPCKLLLHGSFKQHEVGPFESITESKNWIRDCWNRPYTIVKLNKK